MSNTFIVIAVMIKQKTETRRKLVPLGVRAADFSSLAVSDLAFTKFTGTDVFIM